MSRHACRALALAVTLAAIAALPSAAVATTTHYYLALGDSLSQGMQPDLHGTTLDTDQGYADDLLAAYRSQIKGLQLVKLGCGGDTTASLLTGHGNQGGYVKNHCNRTGGSQLAAAVRFLKAHHSRGEVPLVTIDIGANDVDGCVDPGVQLLPCVTAGENSIKTNLPKILSALRKAAPAGTTLAGMNLYDPVLSGYFNPSGKGLATASVTLLGQINGEIASADHANGFRTADVAGAFHSFDTHPVNWEGQQIPANVAYVCSWTWACQTPPSGPNIHANKNGYTVIAGAFRSVVGRFDP